MVRLALVGGSVCVLVVLCSGCAEFEPDCSRTGCAPAPPAGEECTAPCGCCGTTTFDAGPPPTAPMELVWTINEECGDVTGMTYDTCEEVGATGLEITFENVPTSLPPGVDSTGVVPCDAHRVIFERMPVGIYEIEARLVSCEGCVDDIEPLTATRTLDFQHLTSGSRERLRFGFGDFAAERGPSEESPTGTFTFTTTWDGASCADAATPVATERIALSSRGGPAGELTHCTLEAECPAAASSDLCTPADGSVAVACTGPELTQAVCDAPWGHYTMRVQGDDGDGETCFEDTFDVCIGAGDNPAEKLDVEFTGCP